MNNYTDVKLSTLMSNISVSYLSISQTSGSKKADLCEKITRMISDAKNKLKEMENSIEEINIENVKPIEYDRVLELLNIAKRTDMNYEELTYIMTQLQKTAENNSKNIEVKEICL